MSIEWRKTKSKFWVSGLERHEYTDQLIHIEQGNAVVKMGNTSVN